MIFISSIEEIPLLTDLKNDVFTHFYLNDPNDPRKRFFPNLIVHDILKLDCTNIEVLNPLLSPSHVSQKGMVVDLRVRLQDGTYVNVEMQNSTFTKAHYERFEAYGAKMLADQINRGDSYPTINAVYQVIFINDIDADNPVFIDWYQMRNERGNTYKHTKQYRIFVQIPYINEIMKTKKLEELDDVELYAYLLDKGVANDILEVENKEVVSNMEGLVDEFNEDENLRLMAYRNLLLDRARRSDLEEAKQEGVERGLERGAMQEAQTKTIQLFKFTYPNEDTEFLNNLTLEKYNQLFQAILEKKSVDELKALIK